MGVKFAWTFQLQSVHTHQHLGFTWEGPQAPEEDHPETMEDTDVVTADGHHPRTTAEADEAIPGHAQGQGHILQVLKII